MKILLIFILAHQCLFALDIEHYLLPEDAQNAQSSILFAIKDANHSIDIAMFMLTNKKMTDALIAKSRNKDLKIRIVADESYSIKINPKSSKIKLLSSKKNIHTFLIRGLPKKNNGFGILHTKLMIIDGKLVYLGSANWTKSAFAYNYEILIKIHDLTTAKLYQLYFNNIVKHAYPINHGL